MPANSGSLSCKAAPHPPLPDRIRGAELSKSNFYKKMDKVYFKICRLGDIPEEMDSPPTPPSQPVTITKPPPLPPTSIPNIPAPPTPKTLSAKVEIEPKGLKKSMRNMKKEKDQNRKKFHTTRIKKTWSESKLISGNKFQIEKYKQYAEPIVTTRKTSSPKQRKKTA